jgi:hypothetical protein
LLSFSAHAGEFLLALLQRVQFARVILASFRQL